MHKIYSNLSDSVHYNRSAAYLSPDIKEYYGYAARRAQQLRNEMESVLQNGDCVMGFTLNQIADNPVFYQNTPESEELFQLLEKLVREKKAFISTYNGHTASSYAINGMVSSWKRICDDQTDDLRYVSSLIDALADISGDIDPDNEMIIHYSDNARRAAHNAMFGIDRLVMISEGNVNWNSHSVPIGTYIDDMKKRSREEEVFGYYTGLCLLHGHEGYLDRMAGRYRLVCDRFSIADEMEYRPNEAFVNENHMTILSVIQEIIKTDVLERIFTETIDSALEKRIRKRKDEFLSASRTAFEKMADVEAPNRSKMYERAFATMEEYLKPIMGYKDNSYQRNAGYRLVMSFFFQVIDSIWWNPVFVSSYNFFNCLLTFGVQEDVEFRFYPYHTQKGNTSDESAPFDKTRKGVIVLSNELIRRRILYTVSDNSGRQTGSYINFEYAKAAKEKAQKNGTECHIADQNGCIIPL